MLGTHYMDSSPMSRGAERISTVPEKGIEERAEKGVLPKCGWLPQPPSLVGLLKKESAAAVEPRSATVRKTVQKATDVFVRCFFYLIGEESFSCS